MPDPSLRRKRLLRLRLGAQLRPCRCGDDCGLVGVERLSRPLPLPLRWRTLAFRACGFVRRQK
eukprot:15984409-Heterocapsa_arctica.AAC.1